MPGPTNSADADIAASFQQAAIDCLIDRTRRALAVAGPVEALVVAGGVAANAAIRAALEALAARAGLRFVAPPLALCTDNAAMIAWAGIERLALGQSDPLDFVARPRWPLDPGCGAGARGGGEGMSAIGVIGAGAWGTALAQAWRATAARCCSGRARPNWCGEINDARTNSLFLPSASVIARCGRPAIWPSLRALPVLLVVAPAQHLRLGACRAARSRPRDLVLCAKGIEAGTGR
jgi:hypothetical protein